MKLIYSETKKEMYSAPYVRVEVYYPTQEEPFNMPALICLTEGRYNDDDDPKHDWTVSDSRGEASVIREAIIMVDEKHFQMLKEATVEKAN